MTSEQKEILERILSALNIELEDFLLVGNMREYSNAMKKFEAVMSNYQENLIQLNNRIYDVEAKIMAMQQEDINEVLRQDEV